MPDPIFEILRWFAAVAYAGVGGVAHFLYEVSKEPERFSWTRLLINVVLAIFIGKVALGFMPDVFKESQDARDGVMAIVGFLAYPILNFFEKDGLRVIIKRVFNF